MQLFRGNITLRLGCWLLLLHLLVAVHCRDPERLHHVLLEVVPSLLDRGRIKVSVPGGKVNINALLRGCWWPDEQNVLLGAISFEPT